MNQKERNNAEQNIRLECGFLLRQCINDARAIIKEEKMMDMQSHVLSIALALFRKRSKNIQDIEPVNVVVQK